MDLILVVLALGIFFCLILLSWIWPPDSPWSPWWRTSRNTAKRAFKLAGIKAGDVVYELGSGEATALMVAAKDFDAKGVGIEIEPLRYYLAKFSIRRNGLSHKIILKRENFFNVNLGDADVVFVYLVPKTLNRLIPKFKKDLKKGTKIVSFKYEMDLKMIDEDRDSELRLYVI